LPFNKLLENSIYGELASDLFKQLKKLQKVKRAEITKNFTNLFSKKT